MGFILEKTGEDLLMTEVTLGITGKNQVTPQNRHGDNNDELADIPLIRGNLALVEHKIREKDEARWKIMKQ